MFNLIKIKNPKSKSRFWGVSASRNGKNFVAHVKKNGKLIHIGTFSNEIDSAQAYNFAALETYGPKHKLYNLPEGGVTINA